MQKLGLVTMLFRCSCITIAPPNKVVSHYVLATQYCVKPCDVFTLFNGRVQAEVEEVLGTKDHASACDLERLQYIEQVCSKPSTATLRN